LNYEDLKDDDLLYDLLLSKVYIFPRS